MPAALVHYYHKKKKLHASCIFHCYQEHKICPDVLRDRVSVQIFRNFWSMIMKIIEFAKYLRFYCNQDICSNKAPAKSFISSRDIQSDQMSKYPLSSGLANG